jgi:indolepyruvate ferredoxin oxidoreductase alpha subunit
MKSLLTGNEAIARGVYESGIRFAAAYPGTPSTEILENIAFCKDSVAAQWSPNEKVALEAAIGFSIAGGRSFASMKQVGLNVAADPLFSFVYTGCNGGMVLVSTDEPGIHSSQTEQDNRYYAKMAKVPMLEPSDSQEAKGMVLYGIEISEKYRTPVLIRMTTRVCHSKSMVDFGERNEVPMREYKRDIWQYTTMPAVSQKLRVLLEERLVKLLRESENSMWNFMEMNDGEIGIITSGISYQYSKEVFGNTASYLKLGLTYPLPINMISAFAKQVKKLYVIEECEPYMEEQIHAAGISVVGKDILPNIGELSSAIIRRSLLGKYTEIINTDESKLPPRPPVLCAGCPHRGVFYELSRRKNLFISGDIGCYGLGAMPPLSSMDTVFCMGASISGGHGAAKACEVDGGEKRVVSVIGDSTFFHSGMTGLLDVVYNNSRTVTIILDNRITGMTGHQDHPGTGYTAQGDPAKEADIAKIVSALGIENIRTVNPLRLDDMKEALDWAFERNKAAVIICRWPCALKHFSEKDIAEFGKETVLYSVDEKSCVGCRKCISTGCPALRFVKVEKKAEIDLAMCAGCGICAQVCPVSAIKKM